MRNKDQVCYNCQQEIGDSWFSLVSPHTSTVLYAFQAVKDDPASIPIPHGAIFCDDKCFTKYVQFMVGVQSQH